MADNEKDYVRYSIHQNGTSNPPNSTYLPRLNFLNEAGVPPNRNSTYNYNYLPPVHNAPAPAASQNHSSTANASFSPRQSEALHRHESAVNNEYVSRRNTSAEGTRHRPGNHGSNYVSRHDAASDGTTNNPTYPPRNKGDCECQECQQQHRHNYASHNHYLPKRTHSSDSSHGPGGPAFLREDMGEEAALRQIKTGNSISISPEVSLDRVANICLI
jgi:hypothetical protein